VNAENIGIAYLLALQNKKIFEKMKNSTFDEISQEQYLGH